MLPVLLVSISGVGLCLSLVLLVRVREVSRVVSLKRHRSALPAVADLLNHGLVVNDGVIVGKNGTLMAAWEYQGADNASSTDDERGVVSYRINQALQRLGNGWMFHIDAVRRPVPAYSDPRASHFPDPVTAVIDEERRRMFEAQGNLYEGRFILTVTHQPPAAAVRKFSELLFDDDRPKQDDAEVARSTLEQFKREVNNLHNRLSSVFQLRRLGARRETDQCGKEVIYDEFLEHLQRCITGLDHPIRLPRKPVFLDAVLGGQELWGGVLPRVGRKYVQVVAIENFPSESFPGMLTSLGELTVDYRWSTRYIFLDSWEAVSHLEKFRKKWQQQVVPFVCQVLRLPTRNINEDAQSMANDAIAAKEGISAGMVGAGYYTSVVVLMDEDRGAVEAAARQVEKAINHLGFSARIETINTLDAFFGSLPGHGYENVRRPLLNTMNLADLLPVSSIWTGEETCPCPFYPSASPPLAHAVTTGASPFRLNLHVQDLGHTLVFGPTGTGKSTLLGFLAAQLRRYRGMSVFAFDKGMSLYTLCKAAGGAHYHVAGDEDRLAFCPLQHLESKSDRAWAAEWLEQVIRLNGVEVSPSQRNEIAASLENMHRNGHRMMSDFLTTIQDRELRQVLLEYTVGGAMGRVFDAEQDSLGGFGYFTVFEVAELMELSPKYAFPILLYLFRRIERSLKGQPAAILIDEAWIALGHEVFRERIRQWLKELRKANCLTILATQSLSDAHRSGILDVLIESCPTKIFLPNVSARADDAAALYRRFGLNGRELDILATATPKREYYLTSEKGRRLIDLALGPLALAFVGVSDKDTLAEVRKCEAAYGEAWVHEWLARRGLALSDYREAAESITQMEAVV